MKKITALLVLIGLIFAVAACGSVDKPTQTYTTTELTDESTTESTAESSGEALITEAGSKTTTTNTTATTTTTSTTTTASTTKKTTTTTEPTEPMVSTTEEPLDLPTKNDYLPFFKSNKKLMNQIKDALIELDYRGIEISWSGSELNYPPADISGKKVEFTEDVAEKLKVYFEAANVFQVEKGIEFYSNKISVNDLSTKDAGIYFFLFGEGYGGIFDYRLKGTNREDLMGDVYEDVKIEGNWYLTLTVLWG